MATKIFIHIDAAQTCHCIFATETVTCITATEPSINITVAPPTQLQYNLKIYIIATDIDAYIIAIENVSCMETARIDYRSFHLLKCFHSEMLLVIIKKLSKWVSTKFKAK